MNEPIISVVMAVYNGADTLMNTIDSVLAQQGVEFEFIIVNDGSTDHSADVLNNIAQRDPRIMLIQQQNQGLTRALTVGCQAARGEFIARQDVADVSIKDRLLKQLHRLRIERDAVMCSTYAEFIGPGNEFLYASGGSGEGESLSRPTIAHHGCVMMRRDAYEDVGGYRHEFYFAQDADLWSRLLQQGRHVVVPEVLYQARFTPESLSARFVTQQRTLARLIEQASHARDNNQDEAAFLKAAAKIKPADQSIRRIGLAAGAYFIGSCLQRREPYNARHYFYQALGYNPLHYQAWLRLLRTYL